MLQTNQIEALEAPPPPDEVSPVFKRPASSINWGTPPEIVEAVYQFFEGPPDLDPCDDGRNLIGARVSVVLPKDGLAIRWRAKSKRPLKVWVNSPFGSWMQHIESRVCMADAEWNAWLEEELGHRPTKEEKSAERVNWERHSLTEWVERCAAECAEDAEQPTPMILQILPSTTEVKHWQGIIFQQAEGICFVNGRTCYVPPDGVQASTPPMGSAVVLWGSGNAARFVETFQPLGACQARRAP